MEEKKLQFFREMLTAQIANLLGNAEKTVAEMTQRKEAFPDPTDRASLESDRNFELRLRDRQRKLIMKLEEAIARIDDGTYGICEECGCDISEERLRVRPVTTMCIACKTNQELKEKAGSE
ncbi:MAG: RNA polymerase-binding protein DksA [Deltaproteobacteria bacterium]|nr:RNA polymerase-binding protein DksA [Deltaproteobacteria bacterium]